MTNGSNGCNMVSLMERGRDMLGPPSTPRTTQRNIRQGLSLVSAFLPRGPPSSSSIATPTAVNTVPAPSTSPMLVGLTKPSYLSHLLLYCKCRNVGFFSVSKKCTNVSVSKNGITRKTIIPWWDFSKATAHPAFQVTLSRESGEKKPGAPT
jgi:hypothetical protein